MTKILEMTITFSLPDWVGRYDYTRRTYYDNSHQWKGQVKDDLLANEVCDILFKEMDYNEICLHPQGRWVKFEIDPKTNSVVAEAARLQYNLQEVLEGHFKSGRRKPHGNVY